jgi:ketosteroid isomerase-like protein
MHSVDARSSTVESASAVVAEFFDRYRQHDIEGMASLCSTNADFHYVPIEFWGGHRVQRAQGKVQSIGKAIWHGMIASFPDLSVTIQTMTANEQGDVVVQAVVAGTQQRAWGIVASAGRHFVEPHLFILHVNRDQLVDSIRAYWNDASIAQQLGHGEVD